MSSIYQNNEIDDKIHDLTSALSAPFWTVKYLDLSGNKIGDVGGIMLAEVLLVNRTLRSINLK